MAKILYSLIAGVDTPLIEANLGASSNKYVRACRKILKKISRNELRRPDGMATLLSGSFAYNYIHGCDPDENNSTLDSLVFLCVTEALPYAATPSETREAAFRFLSSIRRNFLEHFRGDLNVLLKATSANNLSDTASIDSSQIFSIDQKMKSDLRMFSASMKDEMANVVNDDLDSASDSLNCNVNTALLSRHEDDEKKAAVVGYTDLRSGPPSGSNIARGTSPFDAIIGNIEKVKQTVQGNIEKAIDRHENMALLQSKTDRLADESFAFRNRSRTLHYKYCRDLYKQRCVIVCVIIFVIYLLSAMVCGWGWQSCG
eukprot:470205_1